MESIYLFKKRKPCNFWENEYTIYVILWIKKNLYGNIPYK